MIEMAQRGRKPKPTAIKILEGNPGKRELNKFEPQPSAMINKCPEWLPEEARELWDELAPDLISSGVMKQLDKPMFEALCAEYAMYRRSMTHVFTHGEMYRQPTGKLDEKGNPIYNLHANKNIATAHASLAQWHQIAAEFGMTPSSRTAIIANAVSIEKKVGDIDPMEAILTGVEDAVDFGGDSSNFADDDE